MILLLLALTLPPTHQETHVDLIECNTVIRWQASPDAQPGRYVSSVALVQLIFWERCGSQMHVRDWCILSKDCCLAISQTRRVEVHIRRGGIRHRITADSLISTTTEADRERENSKILPTDCRRRIFSK